jgi:hypothetical protein
VPPSDRGRSPEAANVRMLSPAVHCCVHERLADAIEYASSYDRSPKSSVERKGEGASTRCVTSEARDSGVESFYVLSEGR